MAPLTYTYCWDIARRDQPGPGPRAPVGPLNDPDVGGTPTGAPDGSRAKTTGPGWPETEHVDTAPRVRGTAGS